VNIGTSKPRNLFYLWFDLNDLECNLYDVFGSLWKRF